MGEVQGGTPDQVGVFPAEDLGPGRIDQAIPAVSGDHMHEVPAVLEQRLDHGDLLGRARCASTGH